MKTGTFTRTSIGFPSLAFPFAMVLLRSVLLTPDHRCWVNDQNPLIKWRDGINLLFHLCESQIDFFDCATLKLVQESRTTDS